MNMKAKKTEIEKGILSLVLLAFVFASMGIFARYLGTGFTVFQQVYLRIYIALLLSFIIFRKHIHFDKLKKASHREWLVIALRGLLLYGVAVPLVSLAVIEAKYGNVSFLGTLPFVALFSIIFFKERLTLVKLTLIATAVIGVGFIAIRDSNQLLNWGRGEVAALISGAAFAMSYVARKWHSDLFNNKELTALIFAAGGTFSLLFSILTNQGIPTNWSWGLLFVLVVSALANVANLLLTNYGFERVNNVVAGNILTLEVFFGVAFGYLIYGEKLGIREWVGGALIVISVILMNKYGSEQRS